MPDESKPEKFKSDKTKIRGNAKRRTGPYPLGEIPHSVVVAIGRQVVHRLAVGVADITGNDFGDIFAKAIDGQHSGKPLGLADVSLNECAWTLKTIKAKRPFEQKRVRLISGRNAPVYSSEIDNPYKNIQATGRAVLDVWNERINAALAEHDDLRVFVLIRNISTLEFTVMEYESSRYVASEYKWKLNNKRNFLGYDKRTNEHLFTWQSSGAQFTAHRHVPTSAISFRITQRPSLIQPQTVLDTVGFDESWIQGVPRLPSLSDLDADDNAEEDDSDADANEDGENQQGNAL